MRLTSVAAAITSAIMVFGCAPAAVAQDADTGAECSDGFYAVGGYPKANTVPAGWTSVYTPGGVFPWESQGYNHGQDVGAANVVATVDAHMAQCPDTDVYLMGHSYGAGVMHTASVTLNQRDYAGHLHMSLSGNPRHPGGVDDAWQGWQPLPGVKFRGALPEGDNFASWEDKCNYYRDAICSMPNPLRQPREFVSSVIGYLFTGGHRYPVRPAQPW